MCSVVIALLLPLASIVALLLFNYLSLRLNFLHFDVYGVCVCFFSVMLMSNIYLSLCTRVRRSEFSFESFVVTEYRRDCNASRFFWNASRKHEMQLLHLHKAVNECKCN